MASYIGALDLGTTSNRFILFDHQGQIVGVDQMEHEQIFPRPGWVEHDPLDEAAVSWQALEYLLSDKRGDGESRGHRQGHRCHRHYQPAGNRGGLGQENRPAPL